MHFVIEINCLFLQSNWHVELWWSLLSIFFWDLEKKWFLNIFLNFLNWLLMCPKKGWRKWCQFTQKTIYFWVLTCACMQILYLFFIGKNETRWEKMWNRSIEKILFFLCWSLSLQIIIFLKREKSLMIVQTWVDLFKDNFSGNWRIMIIILLFKGMILIAALLNIQHDHHQPSSITYLFTQFKKIPA